MQLENKFKVVEGYCHVLLDKVIISSSADLNEADNTNSQISLKSILYSMFAAICMAGFFVGVLTQECYLGSFALIFSVLLFRLVLHNYQYSINSISRNKIVKVKFFPSLYGAQHAHILILYKSTGLFLQKRKIYLTNSFANNNNEQIIAALKVVESEFG